MTKNILMGVGNPLRGDDGIGSYLAKNFKNKGWISLDCGIVPENFTSIVKKEKPRYLVIVDAAELSLKPGEFRVVPREKISSTGIGTHSLSLSQLISYLEGYAKKIIFIGIQPKEVKLSEEITLELKDSAEKLMEILRKGKFRELKKL